jgi:recombination protein RecA
VCKSGEVLDMSVDAGIIRKSGSWYAYGDQRLGQGREQARLYLLENAQEMASLERQLLTNHGVGLPEGGGAVGEA